MSHLNTITRAPARAQGSTSPFESVVLLFLTLLFSDWDNFPQVIQNLQKFYAKTPG